MNIIIEKLEKEDLEEAIKVYDSNHDLKTDYNKLLSVYDSIYNNQAYHNIVAKVDNKIVGLATIIINYDIVEVLKPFITVWNLGVLKEYRRKKIGTKMLQYIYDYAKDNNCDFIALLASPDNVVAQTFYENMGYNKEVGYIKHIE